VPAKEPIAPGTKFGKWTVLRRSDRRQPRRVYYRCRCKCGNEVDVEAYSLRTGQSRRCKSCWSCRSELAPGTKFGKYTVLKRSTKLDSNGYSSSYYVCVCECGRRKTVYGGDLKDGSATRCLFCRKNENRIAVGTVFGKRTVISRPIYRKGWETRYRCKCECGAISLAKQGELLEGRCVQCKSCATAERNRDTRRLRPYEAVWRSARNGARKVARGWAISFEKFLEIIGNGNEKCHYCHAPLQWTKHNVDVGRSGGHHLDRKDSRLGYTARNVVPCCWPCNNIKSNRLTYEQYYRMTECFRKNPKLPKPCSARKR
jgi:hypothetical protein